jgi:hypothetical protein
VNTEQVRRGTTFGPLAIALATGALIGIVVGSRLATTDPIQPKPTMTAAIDDVRPDSVSQRLRDAYYAGGGSVEVCVAAEAVVCTRAIPAQSVRGFADIMMSIEPAELASLTPVEVAGGRIIVAGDYGLVGGAAMARIDGGVASEGRLLVVANTERQGIDYVDLGPLDRGTYLVSVEVTTLKIPTVLVEVVIR